MSPSIRLLYVSGPGDVIRTYEHWRAGEDDPKEVAVTYSGQFFDACRDLDAKAVVLSRNPDGRTLEDGPITIRHRSVPFETRGGLLFHIGRILYGLRIFWEALRLRADIVVVTRGTHWFVLALLPLIGASVVPSLHCVLWPKANPPGGMTKLLSRLDAFTFRRVAFATMTISEDVSNQVSELTAGRARPVFPFVPLFRREGFSEIPAPSAPPPFRVLYAGRIEENKGVFDVLEAASELIKRKALDVSFDLCGDGSALTRLRQQALSEGVADRFRCHGHCDRATLLSIMAESHAVVVPTRANFIEGFNKVVVEGVLAGRPVIATDVCPALDSVRDAAIVIPPADGLSMAAAIEQLLADPVRYRRMREACQPLSEPFLDGRRSWYQGFMAVVRAWRDARGDAA